MNKTILEMTFQKPDGVITYTYLSDNDGTFEYTGYTTTGIILDEEVEITFMDEYLPYTLSLGDVDFEHTRDDFSVTILDYTLN